MCIVVCCRVGWDGMGWSGHLGFLQRVKQTVRGRFTSQLEQTDNIDKVCHNTRQTEPKFPTHQDEGFNDSLFQQMKKICPYDFLIIRCVFFVKNIRKHFQIRICIKYLFFLGSDSDQRNFDPTVTKSDFCQITDCMLMQPTHFFPLKP